MSASQRVQILADKAEELSLLAEFLKNPKLITSLQEEIKKLNSLTADEEAKLLQARIDLKEHNNKMFALKKERELLDADKKAHDEYVSSTKNELDVLTENIRIRAEDQFLTNKKQSEKDSSHAEERKQLNSQAADIQRAANSVNDGIAKREAALKLREDKVVSAEAAIAVQKKKLDDKLKLLSE